KEYLELLEDSLGIILDDSEKYTISCYLSPMPFNMIDFSENTIYLNADFSENELFKKFVIMLTKIIVLDWWKKHNNWGWNYNYRAENKIWLFIEIAIDAIFSNTKLHKISNNPSYKFFYNAKINDVYFID
ncbi:MAG: hypothetical protein IJA72_03770, partial [Clostridia bacterium]|nr:hypothetical protein [Clostridia bacterium]